MTANTEQEKNLMLKYPSLYKEGRKRRRKKGGKVRKINFD
jgi:hypothetical protein